MVRLFVARIKALCLFYKSQNNILQSGLSSYYLILMWIFPAICTVAIFGISYLMDITLKKILSNLLTIMPNLIGFLIASATILVSMNTTHLDVKYSTTNITYRQLGGATFLYATKLAILLMLFGFFAPDKFPFSSQAIIAYKNCIVIGVELILDFLFARFLVITLYGLLFISSTIEDGANST